MENICIEYFKDAPIGFAFGKIIRDESGKIVDCTVLYLNTYIKRLFSTNNIDFVKYTFSNIFSNLDEKHLAWIMKETESAIKNGTSEGEIYSDLLNGWYKVRFESHKDDFLSIWLNDVSSERIVIDSSQRIIKSKELSLEELAENARKIAGAKYCLINLFSEDAKSFTTVEAAGDKKDLLNIEKILGFNPINRIWPVETDFTNPFKNSDLYHIKSFDSFMGVKITPEKMQKFKEAMNIGSIYLCKIESDDNLLGVITLIMEKNHFLQNNYNMINFAQLIGLFLIRNKLKEENQLKEKELQSNKEEIEQEKERLENVLKGINAGTWEWNIQTGKTTFNERWASMLGYSLKELEPTTDKTWSSLVASEDLPTVKATLQKHLDSETDFYDNEFRMKHKDGHYIWVHDKGKIEKWTDDGKPMIMYGTHQDITERKSSEITLKNTKKEKEEFFASISHDLKNPMNGIIGFANLLKSSLTDPDDIDCIDSILESSATMMKLISNILDFSKAEAGKLTIKKQRVSLRELITKDCKSLSQRTLYKNITLDCIVDDDVPEFVMTDPLRLNQVIMNLLDNAIKFTEHGLITFRLSKETSESKRPQIRFSVKDTGIGMTNTEKQSILNSFSQANANIERKYGGSGLGLFISSKILELMGSHLDISSKVGEGSMFSFVLSL